MLATLLAGLALGAAAIVGLAAVVPGFALPGFGPAVEGPAADETPSPDTSQAPEGSTEPTPPQTSPDSASASPVASFGPGSGYLVTVDEVRERARRAEAGEEPYRAALDDLIDFAEARVGDDPRPQRVLDIPGTEGPFVDDTAIAYGLALAAVATGDERYAEASRDFIMGWVEETTETRNTCPADGGCQTSLIIGRVAPGFVFAADLLEHADFDVLSEDDIDALKEWLRDVILPTASERPNNWGDTGAFMRVVVADYVGDEDAFDDGIELWKELLDLVAADGHIPPEVERRRSGLLYTQEALDYKIATAVVAERRGIDLWSYRNPNGATLRSAVDYLAHYWTRLDEWPWYDRTQKDVPPGPMWEFAYAKWADPRFPDIIRERRPYGQQGHAAIRWTTFTNGVQLPGD